MSSDHGEKADPVAQCEVPAKRRRGGRRASNPDISAEERKRLRVLKNRESAMKSLAKKAEYSARLEKLKADAEEEHAASREKLRQLLTVALGLRTQMDKVPDDASLPLAGVDTVLGRCAKMLAEEGDLSHEEIDQTASSDAAVTAAEQT